MASLCDISETIGRDVLRLRPKLVAKLLAALNECSEWGQIFLLDALAAYVPEDEQEAMLIVEKTIPRLQHVNSAVMLGGNRWVLITKQSSEGDSAERGGLRRGAESHGAE